MDLLWGTLTEVFGKFLICCLSGLTLKMKVNITANIVFALLGIPRNFPESCLLTFNAPKKEVGKCLFIHKHFFIVKLATHHGRSIFPTAHAVSLIKVTQALNLLAHYVDWTCYGQ